MTKLAENAPRRRRRLSMHQKQNLTGWAFLLPAALLIVIMFKDVIQIFRG